MAAAISATGCNGKAFQVKEGSTVKCSGTISGGSGTCSFSPPDTDTRYYDLIIDGVSKDTDNSACGSSGGGGGGGDSCRDGIQDGDETGVDCGGSCAACETCSGSCGYNAVDPYGNSHCISNCPIDYPNQKWACVPGLLGGCGGKSGCASYDPSKGETPCSPSCGTFYACDKQSVCTETGCRNICATPLTDSSDPLYTQYCDKCNACQNGVQNCGELRCADSGHLLKQEPY